MKRHIGHIFEFEFENRTFWGLCVDWDDAFGYLVGFSSHKEAFDGVTTNDEIETSTEMFAFFGLDTALRRGFGVKIGKLQGFNGYFPTLRGNVPGPDGAIQSWMIYDGHSWTKIDKGNPMLPLKSDLQLCGIGTVKDFLVSGRTVADLFYEK